MTTAAALHELDAMAVARAVAAGALSPVELVDALLDRIDRYDGTLRAWSHLDPDDVRAQARVLADEAATGRLRGPLHGVPVAVKEQFAVAGVPQRRDPNRPPMPPSTEDATVVARLRAAGAVVMGKLYMVGHSGTPPTRNPWNLEHTPGGSSSGCGAAVAARFVPLAMAEQTGGSGLRPPAYCGVAGYKPTYGTISRFGMYAMAWSQDHACINARSVADLALCASVVSGHDPRDPTTLPSGPLAVAAASGEPPRVGIVRSHFPERTELETQSKIDAAARHLAHAGADVRDVVLPEPFGLVWHASALVMGPELATVNARRDAEARAAGGRPDHALPALNARDGDVLVPAAYYLQAQRIRRWLREEMAPLLDEHDLLLMAVAPGPAPKGITTSGDWSLLTPWSFLGNPAMTINGGVSADGMPIGLQLVGAVGRDVELLRAASWCEQVLGRLHAPPMDWT